MAIPFLTHQRAKQVKRGNRLTDSSGNHGLHVFQFCIGRDITAGLQYKTLWTELPDQASTVCVAVLGPKVCKDNLIIWKDWIDRLSYRPKDVF